MDIVVISAEDRVDMEVETLIALLKDKACRIHIRKPFWELGRIEQLIKEIPSEYYHRISLHEHSQLVKNYKLGGLHLKSDQSVPSTWNGILSKSFHELKDLKKNENDQLSYAFLSPVFDSISKNNYQGRYEDWKNEKMDFSLPVYALGGMELDKIGKINSMGFSGFAVIGAIWRESVFSDRIEIFNKMKSICQQKEYSV